MKLLLIIGSIEKVVMIYFGIPIGNNEIYFFPKNYQGVVYIIYNIKKRQLAKYDNSCRLYKVLQDGIIRSQFGLNNGWSSFPKYYYLEKDGMYRIEISFDTEKMIRFKLAV